MLTRRTTIFKTNPISFALMSSPLAKRKGLKPRLLLVAREFEDFNLEGMMRTIVNIRCGETMKAKQCQVKLL